MPRTRQVLKESVRCGYIPFFANSILSYISGWYQGERIRDGMQGWFPSTYTVEIVSSHVRARNLRQRYRMLALSQSYLEEMRREEHRK